MGCVNPDGTLSGSALATLRALTHAMTAEEVAEKTEQPLFKVRAGLREMKDAGLVVRSGDMFETTDLGRKKLEAGSQ